MTNKLLNRIPILALLFLGIFSCMHLPKEHREARSISLDSQVFNNLSDGVYLGAYAGGMNGWRANEVRVTVRQNRVVGIDLISSRELEDHDPGYRDLVSRVIEAQSLDVDAITGATLTTRAHLKAIEEALSTAPLE